MSSPRSITSLKHHLETLTSTTAVIATDLEQLLTFIEEQLPSPPTSVENNAPHPTTITYVVDTNKALIERLGKVASLAREAGTEWKATDRSGKYTETVIGEIEELFGDLGHNMTVVYEEVGRVRSRYELGGGGSEGLAEGEGRVGRSVRCWGALRRVVSLRGIKRRMRKLSG